MPFEPREIEERGPTGGHFALLIDHSGARLAIRPGASLWLVEDKSQADKIYPLTLRKVSHKKLTFEMDGVEYVYQLLAAKPLSKKALKKLAENRAGQETKYQR
jgi:hypothetical protein